MRPAHIVGAVIVVIIVVVLLALQKPAAAPSLVQPSQAAQVPAPEPRTLTIPVVLTKQYFSPNNFSVNQGDTVMLQIMAADIDHSISSAQIDLHETVGLQQTLNTNFAAQSDVQIFCTDNCDPGVNLTIHVQ